MMNLTGALLQCINLAQQGSGLRRTRHRNSTVGTQRPEEYGLARNEAAIQFGGRTVCK